jgi:hypothetical protein
MPAPELRVHGHKHDPVVYLRSDVTAAISGFYGGIATRVDYDAELHRMLAAALASRRRRFELGIATLGPPPARHPGMSHASSGF